MIAPWLIDVLDRELPNLTGGERDRIAQAIIDAFPIVTIATAIRDSSVAVLAQRNILDHGASVARELGNNCGQSVLFALSEAE